MYDSYGIYQVCIKYLRKPPKKGLQCSMCTRYLEWMYLVYIPQKRHRGGDAQLVFYCIRGVPVSPLLLRWRVSG